MKQFMYFLLFTTSILTNLYSQNSSHVFHYPLNIGDFWEYEYRAGTMVMGIECRKIVGDTLMPNGKTYRIISTDFPLSADRYQRLEDSTSVYQFYQYRDSSNAIVSDEFLLYKLDVKVGDTWPYPPGNYDGFIADSGFVEVEHIADTTLWSKQFKIAKLSSFTLPGTGIWFRPDVIMMDSIGVLYDSFEGGGLRLQGAVINGKEVGTITTSVESNAEERSDEPLEAFHNYPNPFNSSTTIRYRLNRPGHVRLSISNLLGQRVKLLREAFQAPGVYRIEWHGDNNSGLPVGSGLYLYVLEINGVVARTKRLSFVK